MTPYMVIFMALFGCSIAFPVRPEDNSDAALGVPIFVVQATGLEEESPPVAYGLLLSKLNGPEVAENSKMVEKRSVMEDQSDDLETAAGTYALRPLFVYRQQLAYRQRVREAIRRGNRF